MNKLKYIIENNQIKYARVQFHKELAKDTLLVTGGGCLHVDIVNKSLFFYSSSHDFGAPTKEQFETAFLKNYWSMSVIGFSVYFSKSDALIDAIKDSCLIGAIIKN